MTDRDGFLSRWSRRKEQARRSEPDSASKTVPDSPRPDGSDTSAFAGSGSHVPDASVQSPTDGRSAAEPMAPPTLDEVESLTFESDFARFVSPQVSGDVRNAALKKLFSDPHFNVMDGLDTYIEDYNKFVPLAPAVLKRMAQAAFLGLVEPEDAVGPKVEKSPAASIDAQAGEPENPVANAATEVSVRHPDERADGLISAQARESQDEDHDLRLQSHHPLGSQGAESGARKNPRG